MILISISFTNVSAQQAVTSTGSMINGAGGSLSYSVGQTFYQVLHDTSVIITEGVQQPYEISVITDIGSENTSSIELNIYPNPTKNSLVLKTGENHGPGWIYQLATNQGEMIERGNILTSEIVFHLSDYSKGIYLLSVFNADIGYKVFKILKY